MVLHHIKEGTPQQEFQNVFRGQYSSPRSMAKAVIDVHQDNTLYHWYGYELGKDRFPFTWVGDGATRRRIHDG